MRVRLWSPRRLLEKRFWGIKMTHEHRMNEAERHLDDHEEKIVEAMYWYKQVCCLSALSAILLYNMTAHSPTPIKITLM